MEKIEVKTSVREETGKTECRSLRKKGFIPGIVYKSGEHGLAVYVDGKDLWKALHTDAGENAIITLDIEDGTKSGEKTVIVQETQHDPINDKLIHVDFHEISLTEKIKVEVPVLLKGEARGVKEEEGVLNQGLWEIEVECLPMEIPEHIDVNVSELMIGDSIHVKDLTAPAGIHILNDPDQVVASVSPPHEEPIEEPAAAALGEEEPEVIKKGKKEEEAGEEEEGKEAPGA